MAVSVVRATAPRRRATDQPDPRGSGPELRRPISVALEAAKSRLLVTDTTRAALFAVDLATGDRTVIADRDTGGGGEFRFAEAAWDANNNRMLVLEAPRDALFAVDLTTGDRCVVSEAQRGIGPKFYSIDSVALERGRGRALVTEAFLDSVFVVDLTSGDRALLSGPDAGAGPAFIAPGDLALDTKRDRALVVDSGRLLTVDLGTGDRAFVPFDPGGCGQLHSVAMDTGGNRAIVTGMFEDGTLSLCAVDLTSGEQEPLWPTAQILIVAPLGEVDACA